METTKSFIVRFKESYMKHSVERYCSCRSREEVIRIYDLDSTDIEWYEIKES